MAEGGGVRWRKGWSTSRRRRGRIRTRRARADSGDLHWARRHASCSRLRKLCGRISFPRPSRAESAVARDAELEGSGVRTVLLDETKTRPDPLNFALLPATTDVLFNSASPLRSLPHAPPSLLPSCRHNYQMEIVLSAVLAELTNISIKFFINKISKPTVLDVEHRLHRILQRAQITVDEAMGRHITNQAMLQQLDLLRDAMHRGYYMLDIFMCQSLDKGDTKDQVMSLSLSKLNFLKDVWSSSRNTQISEQLEKAHDELSSMIIDMKESLVFLTSYPLMCHQPYSMHLLLENCMFGRQSEAELVIKFLLHTHPHGGREVEVLPIVGPAKVGKSTLVAHVCKDERVRDHFSDIWFLRDHDFKDDELATFVEGCAMKHQHRLLNSKKDGRLLIVVDLAWDLNEKAWNKLYSASKWFMPRDSKIIVTGNSEKITKLGTVRALTLKYLSYEAFWYFFKTVAFGSTDPKMHPKLAYLAMEIARTMYGDLIRASVIASILRETFDIHFWYKVLAFLRGCIQKLVSRFGDHPFDVANQNKPSCFGRMVAGSGDLVIYHQYDQRFSDDVPKIRLQDVVFGNVRPHGKFEALVWRSSLPPYHSYVFTCEIGELKTTGVKRKRSMKNCVTLH
ncbi:hypothetical protein PR202_gb12054 [Eleusine coracana subsp. coracana]|uniref:NB-ARC domain-containing protein n=1 Tax=Eleusine coracana subsp. coracana TaxID=191504 RepID=A0AAV5ENK5_ELECO|nr:hypothetical protein PR202_gb12054 [Eleusine coracana subsp. coracana]